MCGYCTETAVIADLLEAMKDGVLGAHDPFLYAIHLQESSDWRRDLASLGSHCDIRGSLVALCRQWSMRLAEQNPMPLGEVLAIDAIADLEGWLATLDYPPEWEWVLRMDGPVPHPLPIELAKATLDTYISAWVRPSLPDAVAWDYNELMERFLSVSAAFDVVTLCASDDARLKSLAIISPSRTPFFDGLDLWLQRRALHACVARSGVHFIKEHLNDLRVEAILSVVMGDLLTRGDLLELRASLQGRPHDSSYLGIGDLLEGLEIRVHQLAREPKPPPHGM